MIVRRNIYIIICLAVFLLGSAGVSAQQITEFKIKKKDTPVVKNNAENKQDNTVARPKVEHPKVEVNDTSSVEKDTAEKTLIYLERTDVLKFDQELYPDAQLLIGDVVLRHDSAYLYCDTAYFFQNENSFHAFGNVKMDQGDTLIAYSDKLYYYGDEKMAKMRYNVHLIKGDVELFTDSLNYDRNDNVGYYFAGGILKDSINTLVSKKGYYFSDDDRAEFKTEVVANNVDFVMNSDTLNYDTNSKIATILGPTTILYQEKTTIYSELGFYNTDSKRAYLKKNSSVSQPGGKVLIGDTIFYDQQLGKGKGYNNVEIVDSSNNVSLWGNYGYYIEEGEIGMVTDSAVMLDYSSSDTLYVNADTLYAFAQDTNKVVLGYNNVRIFRSDLQGVCDSMVFFSLDTVLRLMNYPILWSENNQMSGDTINLYIINETLDKIHIINNAFLAQEEDTAHYNQMSGKEIYCYLKDSVLQRVDVNGNSESLFFPKDSLSYIGMNVINSKYTNAFFKDGKLDRMVVHPAPEAKMLQMSKLKREQKYLMNFTWLEYLRPKDKNDIFSRPKIDKGLEEKEANQEEQRKKMREKREKERLKKLEEHK